MRHLLKILAVVLVAALASSCSDLGKMELRQYRIKEASAESFHAVHGVVELHIANYGREVTLTKITGELFHHDSPIGTLRVDDITIPGNSSNWVDANLHILIEDNVSLLSVLALAQSFNMDEYYVNISSTVKVGIAKVPLSKKNIPLSDFINKKQ